MKRGPQSVQSVPYAQAEPEEPSPPSWQNELLAYGPPCPDAWARHSSEHSIGCGGGGGSDSGSCTTKDLSAWSPQSLSAAAEQGAKKKLCTKPGAAHLAPFQPSPSDSARGEHVRSQ